MYKGRPWDGATDWKDFCKSTPHTVALSLYPATGIWSQPRERGSDLRRPQVFSAVQKLGG